MDLVYFPGLDVVCIYDCVSFDQVENGIYWLCVCDLQLPFHGRPGSLW